MADPNVSPSITAVGRCTGSGAVWPSAEPGLREGSHEVEGAMRMSVHDRAGGAVNTRLAAWSPLGEAPSRVATLEQRAARRVRSNMDRAE